MVWYGMVEVCEGAPVAVSGWVLTDRHDVIKAMGLTGNVVKSLKMTPLKFYSVVCMAFY